MREKIIFLIISMQFVYLTGGCQSRNDFENYLSRFTEIKSPLSAFDWNKYKLMSHDTIYVNKIEKKFLIKYVNDRDVSMPEDGYGYRIRYKIGNYQAVFVRKFYDAQKDTYKFDLNEIYWIIYNMKGEILSKETLSKDSDMWQSEISFKNDTTIEVKQIKILGFGMLGTDNPEKCEISYYNFSINNQGIINKQLLKQEKGIAHRGQKYSFDIKLISD